MIDDGYWLVMILYIHCDDHCNDHCYIFCVDNGSVVCGGRVSSSRTILPHHFSEKTCQVRNRQKYSRFPYRYHYYLLLINIYAWPLVFLTHFLFFLMLNTIFCKLVVSIVYRSKFCTRTGCVVARMDHHCVSLNMTIGYKNHRTFVVFLQLHMYLCLASILTLVRYKIYIFPTKIFFIQYNMYCFCVSNSY